MNLTDFLSVTVLQQITQTKVHTFYGPITLKYLDKSKSPCPRRVPASAFTAFESN